MNLSWSAWSFLYLFLTGLITTVTVTGVWIYAHGALSRLHIFSGVAGIAAAILTAGILAPRLAEPVRRIAHHLGIGPENKKDAAIPRIRESFLNLSGTTDDTTAGEPARSGCDSGDLCRRIDILRHAADLGQLAAGVAHEINNPLGGIIVYANLVLEDMSPADPRRANMEKILRESNRCKMIVRSLLDCARNSTGERSPTMISTVLREALVNLSDDIEIRGITIDEHLDQSLPAVEVVPSQLQEVFENLVRNAAEIMEDGGVLTITGEQCPDGEGTGTVVVTFADTGPGIRGKDLPHIFEPFYSTKKGHGTGLGLPVCRNIVKLYGGTIEACNRNGGGAAFIVRLPAGKERP